MSGCMSCQICQGPCQYCQSFCENNNQKISFNQGDYSLGSSCLNQGQQFDITKRNWNKLFTYIKNAYYEGVDVPRSHDGEGHPGTGYGIQTPRQPKI